MANERKRELPQTPSPSNPSKNPPPKAARTTSENSEVSPSDAPLMPSDASLASCDVQLASSDAASASPDVGIPPTSAAIGGEVANSQQSQPTQQTIDLEQKINDILQTELGSLTDLDNQNKILISMNVKITAKILSILNSHHHNCCGSEKNLESLTAKIAKLETQCSSNKKTISAQNDHLKNLDSQLKKSDQENKTQISDLKNIVAELQNTVSSLQSDIQTQKYETDAIDQYERRDSLIFSGDSVPRERSGENVTDIVLQFLREELFVNLRPGDISVCHRLGMKKPQGNRPIICKFISRSVKSDIKQRCLELRPTLFANESLTPMRREIFTRLRFTRRKLINTPLHFSQLYTNDGKIMIKLKEKDDKFMITNPVNLESFLDKFPQIKSVHSSIVLK